MASIADDRMAAFVARGFLTGSLHDRSMALLASKGFTVGSLADRQLAAGKSKPDKFHGINPTDYP